MATIDHKATMKRLRGDHEATHPTGCWRTGMAGGRDCERIDKDEAENAGIGQIFAGGGVAERPSSVDQKLPCRTLAALPVNGRSIAVCARPTSALC
mgnify:CR=1 FL=1